MKKHLCLGLLLSFSVLALNGCGKGAVSQPQAATPSETELTVFAAASLTETLTELGEQYQTVAPDVTIAFNFDSSGTLKTQIEAGAVCDLFLSAAQKQMDQLGEAVLADTRTDLLENKVVLAVPEGNPAGIASFQDIETNCNLIALGNEDVPVGQYSEEILTNLGILEQLRQADKITYGSNVKEVTTQIAEASVDCGIIYATDAYSAGLQVVAEAGPELCGQVIYPAAVLQSSQQQKAAKDFLAYLQSPESAAVFEKVGFAPVQ